MNYPTIYGIGTKRKAYMNHKIHKDNFLNAQEMATLSERFEAPSLNQLKNLKVGDIVKVANSRERFWTIIEEIHDETIIARVNSETIQTEYQCGDLIIFDKKNIYNIYHKKLVEEYLQVPIARVFKSLCLDCGKKNTFKTIIQKQPTDIEGIKLEVKVTYLKCDGCESISLDPNFDFNRACEKQLERYLRNPKNHKL